jgi:hypothetical protein
VDVVSNDPAKPHFTLKMKGTVEVLAAFEPAWLTIGKVGLGTSKTESAKLVGRDAAKAKLTDVAVSDPAMLKAEAVMAGDAPALKVTLLPTHKVGPVNGTVTAKTGLEKPATVTLTVRAEVSPDLFAEPARVAFAAGDGKEPAVASLSIKSLSGKPFKVKKVTDADRAVQATPQRDVPGTFTLKLVLPDRKSGRLRVETDRKDQAELVVDWTVGSAPATRAMNPDMIRSRAVTGRVRPDLKVERRAATPKK